VGQKARRCDVSKVVNLNGADVSQEAMNADLVDMLEELLARAKAGEITSAAVAMVKIDASIATRWAGASSVVPMAAAVGRLHFDFMTGWGGGQ
jgi:hypothetical protein